ncbi:peptidoglycan DD-metalloendopeptidase family protein [Leucobacter sp. 1207-22]|uniref:peptidoglycan DD-metalloendopeptidase family protein n=1 Tax=Leucobacter sp. 1207-22 TaxID=2604456 RepID=UPI0040636B30
MTSRTSANSSARRRWTGVVGLVAAACLVAGGLSLGSTPGLAVDADLPTWDDVEKAKQDVNATDAKITEIEALLVQVAKEVETTKQASITAGNALAQAEDDLLAANERVEALESKASESAKEAESAAREAASLVSQMYRSGGVDRNMELFLESDASTADQLLERLAVMSKASERNSKVADDATRARNNADTLGQQAESASNERERLQNEAAERKEMATVAAAAAVDKQTKQEEQQATLQAQLDALKDKSAKTVEGYEERVRQEAEEERQRQEAARKAAEEAARKAAENAANNGGNSGGGNNGGGTVNPPTGGGGWGYPLAWNNVNEEFGGSRNHGGIDLDGAEWTPIYAVSAGRVSACYEFSNYGNAVDIQHPDGSMTRYAHQPYGGITVSCGQWVEKGQQIGHVGTTGWSTGPHLHFETWPNSWSRVDPRGFMAARGVYF